MITVVKAFCAYAHGSIQKNELSQDIFLSKGEQSQLNTGKLKTFSVGNKEVIKYKYRPTKGEILIKAKGMGYSDIVIWKSDNTKMIFHIYVTSKREQLQKMEILQLLKRTSLKTELSGDVIYVSGEIKTEKEYLLFKNIEKQKNENLILNISLAKELITSLISKIYLEFYNQGFQYIECNNIRSELFCNYEGGSNTHPLVVKYETLYKITFRGHSIQGNPENLKIEFYILSVESSKENDQTLGVNRIQTNLSSAMKNRTILESGDILLQENNLISTLISNPEIKTVLDDKFSLQLGSEVPIRTKVAEEFITDWRFFGLKLSGAITLQHNRLLLKYRSEFTQPSQEGPTGPKGNSSLYLTLGEQVKLFSINLDINKNDKTSIPGLDKIPIFRYLFQQNKHYLNNKKIHIYAVVKKA